jgi:hypothetical protein
VLATLALIVDSGKQREFRVRIQPNPGHWFRLEDDPFLEMILFHKRTIVFAVAFGCGPRSPLSTPGC